MQPTDQPFRSVRVGELRRLDMCQRALSQAFRQEARRRTGSDSVVLHALASEGERLADLLRERLTALGGQPDAAVDDSWMVAGSLPEAVQRALATYHDHLGDQDPQTARLFSERLIPYHQAARSWLERNSPSLRESEL